MPRIDDLAVSKKVFKKKEYRSWDGNLIDTLKLKKDVEPSADNNESSSVSAKQSVAVKSSIEERSTAQEKTLDRQESTGFIANLIGVQSGFGKGSSVVQLESNKGSSKALSEFNQDSNEAQLKSSNGSPEVQKNADFEVHPGLMTDRNFIRTAIQRLSGNEKKIFFFAINICSQKGSLSTGEINGNDFNKIIETTRNGRETALKRLCKKGLVQRERIRCGIGGAISLVTSELIKTDALNYLNTNMAGEELLTNLGSNAVRLEFKNPLYSSIYNINNNTNTDNKNKNLPEEWLAIDISPLENICFSTTQLRQLVDKNIPEAVQDSINHFAYEIELNPDKYKTPLNVLMGVLRKGNTWTAPKGYESPKDKALREYAERKKMELEKRNQLINDLMEAEFSDWQANLSEDEAKEIIPDHVRKSGIPAARTGVLKNYFKDQILIPRLKKEGVY